MVNRKVLSRVLIVVLTITLIISLIVNYTNYRKTQRENQYVQTMVHQFKIHVWQSADRLGYQNASPMDYPRASAETAAAGSELIALSRYEQMVNSQTSIIGYPPHANAIANFLSFISLSLINDNAVYAMQDGTKYTINQQEARKIVLEITDMFAKNINDNTISQDEIDSMFNQIYNNVIPGFVKDQLQLPILEFWDLG